MDGGSREHDEQWHKVTLALFLQLPKDEQVEVLRGISEDFRRYVCRSCGNEVDVLSDKSYAEAVCGSCGTKTPRKVEPALQGEVPEKRDEWEAQMEVSLNRIASHGLREELGKRVRRRESLAGSGPDPESVGILS